MEPDLLYLEIALSCSSSCSTLQDGMDGIEALLSYLYLFTTNVLLHFLFQLFLSLEVLKIQMLYEIRGKLLV